MKWLESRKILHGPHQSRSRSCSRNFQVHFTDLVKVFVFQMKSLLIVIVPYPSILNVTQVVVCPFSVTVVVYEKSYSSIVHDPVMCFETDHDLLNGCCCYNSFEIFLYLPLESIVSYKNTCLLYTSPSPRDS